MSSDPIPFPDYTPRQLRVDMLKSAGIQDAEVIEPYLDPQKFEAAVHRAAQKPPDIRSQLLAFVHRHAPGTSVVRGDFDGYNWRTGVLTLARETAKGEGMRALLTVAHECAHANQRRDWPWLPWWALKLPPVRLYLETNAWRRALLMLT